MHHIITVSTPRPILWHENKTRQLLFSTATSMRPNRPLPTKHLITKLTLLRPPDRRLSLPSPRTSNPSSRSSRAQAPTRRRSRRPASSRREALRPLARRRQQTLSSGRLQGSRGLETKAREPQEGARDTGLGREREKRGGAVSARERPSAFRLLEGGRGFQGGGQKVGEGLGGEGCWVDESRKEWRGSGNGIDQRLVL